MSHFHKSICYDNENEIANNIYRKVTIPDENKQNKNKNVNNLKNMINDMDLKNKLRLGICITTSNWTNIIK